MNTTITKTATLGSMIPPSILLILYGVYSNTSIGQLFMAGVLPGLLTVVLCFSMIIMRCKLNPELDGRGAKRSMSLRSS
ncbi:TRAP transporter large permease subunit [Allopusillimonas ginsengisoli]|nr:TRAP transporter large permease subunit [Allopusillimonas ginsengisoli]